MWFLILGKMPVQVHKISFKKSAKQQKNKT